MHRCFQAYGCACFFSVDILKSNLIYPLIYIFKGYERDRIINELRIVTAQNKPLCTGYLLSLMVSLVHVNS